jgi:50S ribosomal subunit-associated GTPase HflX
LHVIDSSDPKIEEKIEVVEKILAKIWANQKRIYVFNKIDFLENKEFFVTEKIKKDEKYELIEKKYKNKKEYLKEKFSHLNPIFISAWKNIWIEKLKEKILEEL